MALSGSTDYNMTAGQLINDALQECGIGLNGETPTATETNDTKRRLNMLLKAWGRKGLKLWLMKNESVTLSADKKNYTLGTAGDVTIDRPVEIQSAYRRDSNGFDTPLNIYSREEYRMLSDKSASGAPLNLYYDPQLTNSEMNIWPVPDATDAAEYTLEISYKKTIDDVDATTDDIEVPPEWYLALHWNLAKLMMVSFDLPENKQRRISANARDYLKDAEATDTGLNTSVFFQPNKRG